MVWDHLKPNYFVDLINMKRHSQKERSAFYSAIHDTDKDGAQHQTTELNNKKIDVRTTFDFLSTFKAPNS